MPLKSTAVFLARNLPDSRACVASGSLGFHVSKLPRKTSLPEVALRDAFHWHFYLY